MQYTPDVYVIEGLDGVGKTTLAQGLAERLNGTYIKSPPKELMAQKQRFEGNLADIARFQFYMGGNYMLSEQIREGRFQKPLFIDRFFFSTIAVHQPLIQENLLKKVNLRRLVIPEAVFYLYANPDERIRRMAEKGGAETATDKMLKDQEAAARIDEEYRKLSIDHRLTDTFIRINSTHYSREDTLNHAKGFIIASTAFRGRESENHAGT